MEATLSKAERANARTVIDALEHDAYVGQVVEFLDGDALERFGTEAAWDEMRLATLELFENG